MTLTTEAAQLARPPRDELFRALSPGIELREADTDAPDASPVLFGHFARFDEWTEIDSFFEGRFLERIAPGAFKKTFRERTPKVLFNHGHDSTMGNQVLGEVEDLREDDEGAYYEVRLFDGVPALLLDGLRAGTYGASFRFRVLREDLKQEPGASDHNPAGLPERTIKEAQVFEFGPVTFPAYEGATAGVRSWTDDFHFARLAADPECRQRLITFVRDGAGAEPHATEDFDAIGRGGEPLPADDDPVVPEIDTTDVQDRSTEDAPPKDSAGTESHPDHGRRDDNPAPALSAWDLDGDLTGKEPPWLI